MRYLKQMGWESDYEKYKTTKDVWDDKYKRWQRYVIYVYTIKTIQQCAGQIIKSLFSIRLLKKILHVIKFLNLQKYTIKKHIFSLVRKNRQFVFSYKKL